jgi:hydroxymethylglutaryl-CoA lyase
MTDILISEVGPRDGLQSISRIMSLDAKKAWIAAEAAAGVREIEVGSFVPAKLLPQLADTAEVVAFAKTQCARRGGGDCGGGGQADAAAVGFGDAQSR